jgi:type VI secretion system secreted protein VgrG
MSDRVQIEAILRIDGEDLRVLGAKLDEALDEVPRLEAEVTGDGDTPDPDAVIGKPAVLELRRSDDGASRTFVGEVHAASWSIEESGAPRLRVEIRPKLARLALRSGSEIFQDVSVADLVSTLLRRAGVDFELRLSTSYEKRPFVARHRESELAFLRRLLAEEGIWFVCTSEGDEAKVLFGDDPAGAGPIAGATELVYRATFGATEGGDWVTRVRRVHRVRPGRVTLRDWDFERPKVQLSGKSGDAADPLEVYECHPRTVDDAVLARRAERLLESLRRDRDVITGEAGTPQLLPGRTFAIDQHPVGALDGEVLVVALETEIVAGTPWAGGHGETTTTIRFTAVPTRITKYRPPRLRIERVVAGLETATTTGPAGEEIHVDDHGRVKIRFPWDREGPADDRSSDWARTVQLPTGGAVFLPRVGWEVSVDFLEGDADRPIVFQRLYDGANPPPYDLPKERARGSIQTATTPGGGSTNELRIDDTKGKEEVFFNASKDLTIDVKNNMTESVKNDEVREVGSNATFEVTNSVDAKIGASEEVSIAANQDLNVQTFHVVDIAGGHTATIGANRNMMIGGDHKHEIGASETITIGAIKTDLVAGEVNEGTPATYTHSVGAALVEITGSDRSVVIGGPRTETIGALKVIVAGKARAVDVGAILNKTVGGAILNKIGGDRNDNAKGVYNEVAGGALVTKAANVTFEATSTLSLVMGGSTVIITPASVAIAGATVKLAGATIDHGIVLDN